MSEETILTFAGDISFSGYLKSLYKKKNLFSNDVLDFANNSDKFILNYESPITNFHGIKELKLSHKSNPEVIDVLLKNFDNPILSLANNHMFDYKCIGFLDTINFLEKAKVPYIGAGIDKEDAIKFTIIGEEVKVAIISIQYKNLNIGKQSVFGTIDERDAKVIIKKLHQVKKEVNWTVLIYHGGEEFIKVPFPETRKKLYKFLESGFDVVVGHHPHIVQGYEQVGDKFIFYSLGNFLFDTAYQQQQRDTDKGLLLKVVFNKEKMKFKTLFTKFDRNKDFVTKIDENKDFILYNKKNYKKYFAKASTEYSDIQKRKKQFLQDGVKKRSLLNKLIRIFTKRDRIKRRIITIFYKIKYNIFYK